MKRQRKRSGGTKGGLATVRRLADEKLALAARELAASRQALTTAEASLEQLGRYLSEYSAGDADVIRASAAKIASRRAFIGRICAAAREQDREVARLRDVLADRVTAWESAKAGVSALETIEVERRSADKAHKARSDQRTEDEFAARIAASPEAAGR